MPGYPALLFPVLLLLFPLTATQCPEYCSCVNVTVKCTEGVPVSIPTSAKILDISRNRLHDDSWEAIYNLTLSYKQLSKIILTDNSFSVLPTYFTKFTVKFDLRRNPLHCDCGTVDRETLARITQYRSVVCSSTTNPILRSIPLSSLSSQDLQCELRSAFRLPTTITLFQTTNQVIPCERLINNGTVTWLRHNKVVMVTDAEDCSLDLSSKVTKHDQGSYEVRLQTPYSNTSTTVDVIVCSDRAPPQLNKSEGGKVEVIKGGSFLAVCNDTTLPRSSITWTLNFRPLTSNSTNVKMLEEHTILLTDIKSDLRLSCMAVNPFGKDNTTFDIVVVNSTTDADLFNWSWVAPTTFSLLLFILVMVVYLLYLRRKVAILKAQHSSTVVFENTTIDNSISSTSPGSVNSTVHDYRLLAISKANPPNQLICPITRECMKNPVVATDGFSYEEKAILAWFRRSNTSPMTNGDISKRLVQNHNLRTLINDLMEKKPISDGFINLNSVMSPPLDARTSSRCSCGSVSYSTPSEPALSATSGDKILLIDGPTTPSTTEASTENASPSSSRSNPLQEVALELSQLPPLPPPEVQDNQTTPPTTIPEVETRDIQAEPITSTDIQSDSLYPEEV